MLAKLLPSCLTLRDPVDCSPQASLSMGFSRQEYWRGLSFPLPGDHPDPEIKPTSFISPLWQLGPFPLASPGKPSVSVVLGYALSPHKNENSPFNFPSFCLKVINFRVQRHPVLCS